MRIVPCTCSVSPVRSMRADDPRARPVHIIDHSGEWHAVRVGEEGPIYPLVLLIASDELLADREPIRQAALAQSSREERNLEVRKRLGDKRRAGQRLTAEEQEELMDMLMGL